MFTNKKINYIFVSLGDERISNKKPKKIPFFNKFSKIIKKNENQEIKETSTFDLSEKLVSEISKFTEKKCFSFYLNLENMHDKFITEIQKSNADRFFIFSLYPQFRPPISLISDFFSLNLYDDITNNFFWIKSFHNHDFFIKSIQKNINTILKKHELDEKETIFLFFADELSNCPLYTFECEITSQSIIKAFQFVEGSLFYYDENQIDLSKKIKTSNRKNIIIIPITTIIDDIKIQKKTEILQKLLEKEKKSVFICKTLNHNPNFIRSILDIIDEKSFVSNKMLTSINQ
jgi:protoheme ferro-lyase